MKLTKCITKKSPKSLFLLEADALERDNVYSSQPDQVAELEDLLRDPIDRVREAAMAGLRTLGEASAIAALSAYRDRISDQGRADVDRAITALQAAATPGAKAKDEAVEELRKQVRSLSETVETLKARMEAEEA